MRKITIILLFALSLVSCGGDNDDTIDTDQTFLEKYDGTRWFIQIEDDQTFWRFNNSLAYPISVRYYDNYNDCYLISEVKGFEILENKSNIFKIKAYNSDESDEDDFRILTMTISGDKLTISYSDGDLVILDKSEVYFDDLQMCSQ